jgi:hypothetical protein
MMGPGFRREDDRIFSGPSGSTRFRVQPLHFSALGGETSAGER